MNKLSSIQFVLLLLTGFYTQAQNNILRVKGWEQNKSNQHPIQSIKFRNVGPSVMSGRVTSLSVNPNNTNEFYVAYASGGLFYTNNNGQSFAPVFDKEATLTIGAIAVNWQDKVVWIGTGEVNSSRSSYAGLGIYKSTDSCKSWQHMGLIESQHIGSIILHPKNKEIAYVASLGALYTNGGMPGLFKTIDGGKSWQALNLNNNNNGVVQLKMDPVNENVLYACTWDRSRKAWNFEGNGLGSAIYKSIDAGISWQLITGGTTGFPKDSGVGRIGIAISPSNTNVLYALLDNQNRQTQKKESKVLTALTLKSMTDNEFLNTDEVKLNEYLKNNGYEETYTASSLKKDVKSKKLTVNQIAQWVLDDADNALFQTPIIGAELYKSINGGKTWNKTHQNLLQGLYFTYGYYFGNVYTTPNNDNEVYLLGFTVLKSKDGGKTFKEIVGENVHPDHHALWINPNQPKHLVNGNDGGINISYDDGANWIKANTPCVAQCYAITVDNATPYNVYCGLQDNGTWFGSSENIESTNWHQSGQYAYQGIGGGDGMQIQVDDRDNETVYTGYQFGYYQKGSNKNLNKEPMYIHPTNKIGEAPLRYNWQTPILLSKHNQDIFYMGSNKFHRSLQKGAAIKTMEQDLARTNLKGNVPYGSITSISESPLQFGLIFTGSDNGKIFKSTDVGVTFAELKLPKQIANKNLWVSRIIASKYNAKHLWITLNGYRQDNFEPYVLQSTDGGVTFIEKNNGLPLEPVNVIREDEEDGNILYLGTDNGLYITYNQGNSWMPWQSNLPRVAVHDIAIQPIAKEIVLGTHGRSIFIASIKNIKLMDSLKNNSFILLDATDSIKFNEKWGSSQNSYSEASTPKIKISYFSNSTDSITLKIFNQKKECYTKNYNTVIGYNNIVYKGNLINNGFKGDNNLFYTNKGKYELVFYKMGKEVSKKSFIVW